jgi:hypothetical protein
MRLRQEDHEFEASLRFLRLYLKKTRGGGKRERKREREKEREREAERERPRT